MQWKKPASEDYAALIELWEKSVLATHDFLASEDREALKKEIPAYFPQLDMKMWFEDTTFVGFSGVNASQLEMLFLDPEQIGKGLGSRILNDLIEKDGIKTADVNKDNTSALAFYLKNNFQVTGESEQDDQGRDYPILHLCLKAE
ncbi:GNAT family N-acetyltransferase [Oceanobacillus oncorhynchi]|uniref:GNAT family N-acetyltransferase n=1 Tax=Oceanobacillus oncorhynchi TaxID=545501 RepID=UPI002116CABB|nr:GNAT family N-acetyltransferase [Oceanobacillus oncorhynchi]UUI41842.1 GNAT family N-acetyltransferase [Oceanobacillus oncorhynchi]